MELVIFCKDPYVNVRLDQYGHRIVTSSDEPQVREITEEIAAAYLY